MASDSSLAQNIADEDKITESPEKERFSFDTGAVSFKFSSPPSGTTSTSPDNGRNGARARAKLQISPNRTSTLKMVVTPHKKAAVLFDKYSRPGLIDVFETFADEAKHLIVSIKGSAKESHTAIVTALEALQQRREPPVGDVERNAAVAARARQQNMEKFKQTNVQQFTNALTGLSHSDAVWFMNAGGYDLVLMLASESTLTTRNDGFMRRLFETPNPDVAENMWRIMRAAFIRRRHDPHAVKYFMDDVQTLAVCAGFLPETIVDLAVEFPSVSDMARDILVAMHKAYAAAGAAPEQLLVILVSLARLCAWLWDYRPVLDSNPVNATCALLAQHLNAHPTSLDAATGDQLNAMCDLAINAVKSALRSTGMGTTTGITALLEAALAHGGTLTKMTRTALVRAELLDLFVKIGRKSMHINPPLLELLMVPYLPGVGDIKATPFPFGCITPCGQMLDDWSAAGTNVALLIAMHHLVATLVEAPSMVPVQQGIWEAVAAREPGVSFIQAIGRALAAQLAFRPLLATPLIEELKELGRPDPIVPSVNAHDVAGCSLLLACGWDPYVEYPRKDGLDTSAFVEAVVAREWDIVRCLLTVSYGDLTTIFSTPIVVENRRVDMTGMALLAFYGQADLMKILMKANSGSWSNSNERLDVVRAAAHAPTSDAMEFLRRHHFRLSTGEGKGKQKSALYYAIKVGSIDTVAILLEELGGHYIQELATKEAFLSTAYNERRYNVLNMLLEHGVSPEEVVASDTLFSGGTILMRAIHDHNFGVARMLLDWGAEYTDSAQFWVRQTSATASPDHILLLLIAHGIKWDDGVFAQTNISHESWTTGPFCFTTMHSTLSGITAAMELRLLEIMLDYRYVEDTRDRWHESSAISG